MDYTKMIELSDLAEEVDDALKRIDDIDLSNGDAAYYMDTNAKILEILKEIGG